MADIWMSVRKVSSIDRSRRRSPARMRVMTDGSGATAPGYNERCQTRASVITRWMLLVPGCAMPLLVCVWNPLSVPELVGVAAGIATWTAVMIRLHVWRLADGEYGETTRLSDSAALFMVLQWLAGALAPPEVQFVFYSPAVILASRLVLGPLELADPLITYVLTLACGGQVLACVLALWWAAGRLQRRLNRPR